MECTHQLVFINIATMKHIPMDGEKPIISTGCKVLVNNFILWNTNQSLGERLKKLESRDSKYTLN